MKRFLLRSFLFPKLNYFSRAEESLEELELAGEKTVRELNKNTKNILAPLRSVKPLNNSQLNRIICSYHWPNGVLYYTIDAAFSESERAVIASGFSHVEENSCIRYLHI